MSVVCEDKRALDQGIVLVMRCIGHLVFRVAVDFVTGRQIGASGGCAHSLGDRNSGRESLPLVSHMRCRVRSMVLTELGDVS